MRMVEKHKHGQCPVGHACVPFKFLPGCRTGVSQVRVRSGRLAETWQECLTGKWFVPVVRWNPTFVHENEKIEIKKHFFTSYFAIIQCFLLPLIKISFALIIFQTTSAIIHGILLRLSFLLPIYKPAHVKKIKPHNKTIPFFVDLFLLLLFYLAEIVLGLSRVGKSCGETVRKN